MSGLEFWPQAAAALLVLATLATLGTGRLSSGIRLVGLQGVLLATIVLVGLDPHDVRRGVGLALATAVLKGAVVPWLLARAQRVAQVHEELEPLVSHQLSLTGGVVALGVAVWLSHRLTLPPSIDPLLLAVGLFMVFSGLIGLITRRIAIGQVLGYIVLENGIALFGLTVARDEPLLVELAVLLDLFVAVFLMGIAIAHISREFDHIEVDRLSALRD